MKPFELESFCKVVAEQSGLAKTGHAILRALTELARAGQAPEAAVEGILLILEEGEGRRPDESTFRQRLKRANDELAKTDALFRLETRDGKVRAIPSKKWDIHWKTVTIGDTLDRSQEQESRIDPAFLAAPRAVQSELQVFFSYGSLNDGQQQIQDAFFTDLKAELAGPPERWRHLPRIKLWRDKAGIDRSAGGQSQMDEACRQSFLILMMLSTKYFQSDYCIREAGFFMDDQGTNKDGKRAWACV